MRSADLLYQLPLDNIGCPENDSSLRDRIDLRELSFAQLQTLCSSADHTFKCKRLWLGRFGSVEGYHAPMLCLPNVHLRKPPVIGEFFTVDLASAL